MNCFRHPRTTAERRANYGVAADGLEYGLRVRPARRGHLLVSAWDDQNRSTCDVRCWKHYRCTQYKAA
jgi:hypothetical protein